MHTKPGMTCTTGGSDGVARDGVTTKEARYRPEPPRTAPGYFYFLGFCIRPVLASGASLTGERLPLSGLVSPN